MDTNLIPGIAVVDIVNSAPLKESGTSPVGRSSPKHSQGQATRTMFMARQNRANLTEEINGIHGEDSFSTKTITNAFCQAERTIYNATISSPLR